MKRLSLYFTSPHEVSLREQALGVLAPAQLLVKTIVSAISPGTEMLLYRGEVPTELAVDETIASLGGGGFAFPLKYGYAAVGQVIEIGKEVDEAWLGRLVFAFNPHESHFLATASQLEPLAFGFSPENAVFLANMETAISFLMDGQPMIGEQVAIFGQGIVGLLTTRLLSALPLSSLLTVDYYPLRRKWSRQFGAQHSFDPKEPDMLTELRSLLQGKRPYAGADLTYELSGNPQALDQAIQVTGFNGRVLIGSWYGQKRANLDLGGYFHRSQIRLISSQVSHLAPQWRGRFRKSRRLQVAWAMIKKHQPVQLITHRYPITQAADAYRMLAEDAGQAVQVVFTYE